MTSLLNDARRGSRTPRVSSFPAARSSAGRDAIELAESAGLFLDPWQQDVLCASLGEMGGGRWAAPEVGLVAPRQNGKGAVLEARELAGLFLFGESILHTSHEFKTSMDHFRRLERLIRDTPDLHRKVAAYPRAPGTEGIVLRDGRALRFMARTKGSGRGFPADVVVLDEAFALTDEQNAALLPTMSSRPNPQTWYTSSPPLDGITGEPLFTLRARGEAGDGVLAWFDWGAELGVDPDDRDVWWATNPAMGYRITEDSMARLRAALSPDAFSRECLGVWPRTKAEQWLVIPKTDWDTAADADSAPVDPVAFAASVSKDRDFTSIGLAGVRGDGLLHVEVIDRRPGTDWVIPRLLELRQRWAPCATVIDAGGPSGSLVAPAEAAGLTVTKPTVRDITAACGALYDGVCGPGEHNIRHRGQAELDAAVAAAPKRPLGAAWAWDQMAAPVDISPVLSVTNALGGYLGRVVEAEQQFFGSWR